MELGAGFAVALSCWSARACLIQPFAAASLLHGDSARRVLVRPFRYLHVLLRCVVRIWAARFREWRAQRVCAHEVVRRKTDTRNPKEEPLNDARHVVRSSLC